MNTLFPILPEGFRYTPEFLSRDEERILLEYLSSIELNAFLFRGYEAKRRVASFGYDYRFESGTLEKGRPIPGEFKWLIEKVSHQTRIPESAFAEVLITRYPVGAVINWHRDAHPFETIAGVSMGGSCTFRLRPREKEKQTRHSVKSVQLEPRSLYIITGKAREEWEHSTLPVEKVRYSITLRTLKAPTGLR